jgi:hypothetical protein
MTSLRIKSSSRSVLRCAALVPAVALLLTGCMNEQEAHEASADIVSTQQFSSVKPSGDWYCDYGAADCNGCVNDVPKAFNAISARATAQIRYWSEGGHTLPPFSRKLETFEDNDSHVQSVVRLSGVGADLDPNGRGPWFAFSRANPGSVGGSGVFTVQLADFATHGGYALEASARGKPADGRGTKAYYPVEGLDHAGGMQAIGRFVVSGSSCDTPSKCGDNGYAHVWNFTDPRSPGAWVSAVRVGDQGEPGRTGAVTSAAITRLASGQYLLFVQGKDTAHEGWFYLGDGGSLANVTAWRYAGYATLPGGGANEFQNTQLVTECGSGDIYMVGSGNADYDGSIDDVAQTIFKVTPGHNHMSLLKLDASDSSFAALNLVTIRQFSPGDGDYCTFRAGASVHVTPDYKLAAYCTTRKANTDLGGDPDSKLKMEEYGPR